MSDEEDIKNIEQTTKKGFDLSARLQNRGLRHSTITLFLDEDKGPELGWAYDRRDVMGNFIGRVREGVLGDIDRKQFVRAMADEDYKTRLAAWEATNEEAEMRGTEPTAPDFTEVDAEIAELEKKRDEMIEELTKTGIRLSLRAVPPIIQKDTNRRARDTLGDLAKGEIPEPRLEEYNNALARHLLSVMVQSVTDNATGDVNDKLTFEDAGALLDYLPVGQYRRLDEEMGKLQFTDAISQTIEAQEDFS